MSRQGEQGQDSRDVPSGTSTQSQGTDSGQRPLVAGLAASAGGLEALRAFVTNLPVLSRVAYVVVQHLSPSHRSLLVELLRRETRLEVLEINDGMKPGQNVIHITPPGSHVTIEHGTLHLKEARTPGTPKPSADQFLCSLARDQGESALAVILSGTGSDGAKGVCAVKAVGGFTFAQDPESAKYDGMPKAAKDTGCIDIVLPPEEIAREIGRLSSLDSSSNFLPPEVTEIPVFRRIFDRVHEHTGTNFLDYKEKTVRRRLARRMLATNAGSLEDYEQLLIEDIEEAERLHRDILISVTSFFRDTAAYGAMEPVIDNIVKAKEPGDEIRFWVAGCATGEEAYSLALLLSDRLGTRSDRFQIQVFATDLDQNALTQARKGIYDASTLDELHPDLVERHFRRDGENYQVSKSLREMMVFANQDLTRDPPFLRMDLISCQNVLIYFKPEVQDRVLRIFHYALRPGGHLFLGKSESPQRVDRFNAVDNRRRIFKRKELSRSTTLPLPNLKRPIGSATRPGDSEPAFASLEEKVKEIVNDAYIPSGVVVDGDAEIRYVLGDVAGFMGLSPGRANLNAALLLRTELRGELRGLLAKSGNGGVIERGARVAISGLDPKVRVRIAVHPVSSDISGDPLFLACFETLEVHYDGSQDGDNTRAQGRISEQEQELAASREHLQTVIEELETSNEELQSLNEELQSANEEMQSTNEELETANEELQATNEELTTVNEELQTKSTELSTVNADLENVKDNLPYPLVVVDETLRIMLSNPSASEVWNLPPDSVGLDITSLSTKIEISELRALLKRVIRNNQSDELQVTGPKDFMMKVGPYHDEKGRCKGAVIAFWNNTELRQAEQTVRESAARIELQARALDAALHGIVISDATQADAPIVYVNPAFEKVTGYAGNEVLGRNCRFLQGPDTSSEARRVIGKSLSTESPCRITLKNYRKNGHSFWNDQSISPVHDTQGNLTHFIAVQNDITERREAEERARLAVSMFENTREGILITDFQHRIVSVNAAFVAMTGYSEEEILSKNPRIFHSGHHDDVFYRSMWSEIDASGAWKGEIRNRRKDGSAIAFLLSISSVRNSDGEIIHYVGIYSDITAIKEAEDRLQTLAYYDSLTELPNRTLVYDRLHHALDRAIRDGSRLGVMFLDIDRFKTINDTLGHEIGDQLLKQAAQRVSDCVRDVDTVARLGGDEFIILLECVHEAHEIHHIASRVLNVLSGPYQVGGREVFSSASIGVALYPDDGTDVDTLLRNADTAMYRSKSEGRNTYSFYAAAMNAQGLERLQLENDLRRALERAELVIHYQPKINLISGETTGVEALLRWDHPRRGLLVPSEFIAIAEESGLILDIDRWVLDTVARQHCEWLGSNMDGLTISVNLSARHLRPTAGLQESLKKLGDDLGVRGDWLELEVLESSMMPMETDIPAILEPIKELGVRLAIDDFGTGYSNLAYLKHWPIDTLKIDQSFVREIIADANDAAIVEAITVMSKALDVNLVAEGIETPEQVSFLKKRGCPYGQGFLFARPMPVDDFVEWQLARSDQTSAHRNISGG